MLVNDPENVYRASNRKAAVDGANGRDNVL